MDDFLLKQTSGEKLGLHALPALLSENSINDFSL